LVTDMSFMFSGAILFNYPLEFWNVSSVTDMMGMFRSTSVFNQDISNWCVEQIATLPNDFALSSSLQISFQPNWGEPCAVCPNGDNFSFSTQAQIDNFGATYAHCTDIVLGNVFVSGSDITNLDGLSNLTSIGGNLSIDNNSALIDLDGLTSLTSVGGSLRVFNNVSLINISGIENIDPTTIASPGLFIQNNTNLAVCNLPNICTYLAGSGARTISGNLAECVNEEAVVAACDPCPSSNILYVNTSASGANTGKSWNDAYTDLQSALESTCTGITEIWVAKGTYKPSAYPEGCTDCASDRDFTFLLRDGVSHYGGFDGTETALIQRDFVTNETIVSGDIGNPNDASDNVHHVIMAAFSSMTSTTRLDGFTVTAGNADGSSFTSVNGTAIFRNDGGGIFTTEGTNTLINNAVSGNSAFGSGGGIFTLFGTNTLANNAVSGNMANTGGGIVTQSGTNTLTNNKVSGNQADLDGGGIYTLFGTNTLINNTVSGNQASFFGGGIFTLFGTNTLINNIIWGNNTGLFNFNNSSTLTANNNIIQGGFANGTGNLDEDPLFVNLLPAGLNTGGDYRLQLASPAVDIGNNTSYTAATGIAPGSDFDIVGNDRLIGTTIDMGAFELKQTSWTGVADEDWTNVGNWASAIPDLLNPAIIRDIAQNTPRIEAATSAEVNQVFIATTAAIKVNGVLKVTEELVNNGNITFKSDGNKTGQLDEFNGSYSGSGTVEVERFIPAGDNEKRAFRFLSSSVNSTENIRTNWQEGATAWNDNPSSGFGTHITGVSPDPDVNANPDKSQDGDNGFDWQPSGNSSLFLFNVSIQEWEAINNTNANNLEAGKAYRLMVRGDRSINLMNNASIPTNTVLRAKGDLVFGPVDVSTDLAQGADEFSLVGNPYQAVIDFSEVEKTNLINYIAVWDANLTGSNGRGSYVSVDISETAPSPSSSGASKFIAPNQAFFVRNTSAGNSTLIFNEGNKATAATQVTVFNTYSDFYINSRLYKTVDLQNGNTEVDAIGLRFNENYTTQATDEDAEKLTNPDENYAISNNGLRSIDKQDLPIDGHEIQLFINSYTTTAYSLTFAMDNLPEGLEVFLNDSYLNTQTQLSAESVYDFTVDANIPASIAFNRFSLSFDNTTLGVEDNTISNNFTVYPNPVEDVFYVAGIGGEFSLIIYDVLGRGVLQSKLQGATTPIYITHIQSGVYVVKIKTADNSFSQQIIKK